MNARPLPILALILVLALLVAYVPTAAEAQAPASQMTWAVHVSLAPTWFDPAETPGIITSFMVLYALHDAMVKPMPGNADGAVLAESWTHVQGRPSLRVRAAQGRHVPQRRSASPPTT